MKKKSVLSLFALLLGMTFAFGQLTGNYTYDFTDGSIISNGQSEDASLILSGNYSHHGEQYGLNMKVDSEIKITVDASHTIKFLGSKYSKLNMLGTANSEGDLGTQNTQVTNDLAETYDFVYSGGADTLSFKTIAGTGNDLYLPSIELIPAQLGNAFNSAEKNIIYFYDFRDGSIVPTSTDGKSDISMGLIDVKVGPSNAYGYNGDQHGSTFKAGNQLVLQVAGNSIVKIGGCTYSAGTISVSSETGQFDIATQAAQASGEYHNDGTTIDFLYAGEAGTVTIDFTATTYVPSIEIVPVTTPVELSEWVQKTGTITLNGNVISFTAGENSTSNATVTVSEGTVVSATAEMASIRMSLNGEPLDSFTPELSGDIASVTINGNVLELTFSGENSLPESYSISITDNSQDVIAEAGKTYSYNLADGSEMPQNTETKYSTFITSDGIVTMNSNESDEFWYHDSSHGAVFYNENSMDILVAGNATITFITCTYSKDNAVFVITNENGTELGTIAAENKGGDDAFAVNFSYTGPADVLTLTLLADGDVYIHGLTIENAAAIEPSNGLTDVWDFGAEQLDESVYNNNLNESIINSWYDASISVGSAGNVLPSFSAGVLSWIGGGNDRLRTSNTNLTRYDENLSSQEGYTGRIYVNSGSNSGRYMSLALSEDDEVTIMAISQNGGGLLNFEYVSDPEAQTDVASTLSDITEVKFVAKAAGTYHIYDTQDKPSYYRIYRADASYITLTGNVDVSEAEGISADYAIVFTNEAGKTWNSVIADGSYNVDIPAGYTYELSLLNADKYIINSGTSLDVTEETSSFDVAIEEVALYTVSGSITGLTTSLEDLEINYTPDASANKIYKPEAIIDVEASTYTVQLEPGCEYTISAKGVNDYFIPNNTKSIGEADESAAIVFETKPVYDIAIEASGLNQEQLAKLGLTFSNLNEEGYSYTFTSIDNISLRDGTYTISISGLEEYALQLGLTSNLSVDGVATSKTLEAQPTKDYCLPAQLKTKLPKGIYQQNLKQQYRYLLMPVIKLQFPIITLPISVLMVASQLALQAEVPAP
jgi:hypothetical protein